MKIGEVGKHVEVGCVEGEGGSATEQNEAESVEVVVGVEEEGDSEHNFVKGLSELPVGGLTGTGNASLAATGKEDQIGIGGQGGSGTEEDGLTGNSQDSTREKEEDYIGTDEMTWTDSEKWIETHVEDQVDKGNFGTDEVVGNLTHKHLWTGFDQRGKIVSEFCSAQM